MIRKHILGGVAASVAMLLLAACASSGSTGASKGTQLSSADKAGLQQALADVTKYSQPVEPGYNPGQLSESVKAKVKGKTFACVHLPVSTGVLACNDFAKKAALLGIKVVSYDGGSTAEDTTNLFNRLANDPSFEGFQGMFVVAYEPSMWQQQFNTIAGRGIPIVLESSPDNPAWSSKSINIASNNREVAYSFRVGADWIVAESKGTADTLYVNIPASPALLAGQKAFSTEYSALCPKCGFVTANAAGFNAIGTTIPGLVASYLQSHPKIKYVFAGFGDILNGVAPAVSAAGITGIKYGSLSGSSTTVAFLKANTQTMVVAWPFSLISYVAVDSLARAVAGGLAAASVANTWNFPVQLITSSDVHAALASRDMSADGSVDPTDLAAYFAKLWNLPG